MRTLRSRLFLALVVPGFLLALSAPAQAAGYHNPGQYYGPPPQPYQAHAWSGNPSAPAGPVVGREGGSSYYGNSGYQQPYHPSQPSYSSAGFRPTTLNTNYASSGVYRVTY